MRDWEFVDEQVLYSPTPEEREQGEEEVLIYTYRRAVPGGWLVLTAFDTDDGAHSTTFLPDPEYTWELSKFND